MSKGLQVLPLEFLGVCVCVWWFISVPFQFCVTVELSKPLTVQDMLHKLVSKGLLSAAVSQSLGKGGEVCVVR